ncbi:MAG TPA: rod shape-determining protein MreC [Acidimicrobiia bacterium]|nr:rod shape-determining protein MreC [Acidimicrobiia bacterium]
MLSRQPGDRTFPTLITLLVLGLLLMTFDVRSEGAGVTSVLRTGTQTLVAPLQKAAAFVVNPVIDAVDSLSNIATLREQNRQLAEDLAEAEAAVIAVADDLARLEFYEEFYEIDSTGNALARTVAQVIGRADVFDRALRIDKGTAQGITVGQPVIDTSGYLVGTVQQATSGTAIVVPITAGPDSVAVTVGTQVGMLVPQIGTDAMRLEILDAREPVLAGDRVVTSSASIKFPSGYPVGQVIFDAAPTVDDLVSTEVMPFTTPETLRVVVVLAWPPDPITAATDEEDVTSSTTTSTTMGTTSTSGADG